MTIKYQVSAGAPVGERHQSFQIDTADFENFSEEGVARLLQDLADEDMAKVVSAHIHDAEFVIAAIISTAEEEAEEEEEPMSDEEAHNMGVCDLGCDYCEDENEQEDEGDDE